MKTPANKVFCLSITDRNFGTVAQLIPKTRAFGRFTHAGSYTTTITRPTLFRSYLNEQLTLLYQDYGAHISVQPSQHEIPYPYVIDGSELTPIAQ